MSERHVPSNNALEVLSEDQLIALHEQAERLFLAATFRFDQVGVGRYGEGPADSVRYRNEDGELVTITAPGSVALEFFADDIPKDQLAEHRTDWLNLSIETPLPVTDRWPNTYIKHHLVVSKPRRAPRLILDEKGYTHFVDVNRYSEAGVLDTTEGVIVGEFSEDEQNPLIVSAEQMQRILDRQKAFAAGQWRDLKQGYPGYLALMEPHWTSGYCLERIAMLAGLTMSDEVGCLPNPYVRDSRT